MPVDKKESDKALAVANSRYTKKLLCTNLNVRLATVHKQGAKEDVLIKNQENNTFSLAHTKWNSKYHKVFALKYQRKVFFEDKRQEIRDMLRTLSNGKE